MATVTRQFPQTHDDLYRIYAEHGENFRLDHLVFKHRDGFRPDGSNYPLGEVKANYEKQGTVLWNMA